VRRPEAWRVLVPVAAVGAGLLFATSAATADGTDLRSDRRLRLAELVGQQERELQALRQRAQALRDDVDALQLAADAPAPQLPAVDPAVAASVGLLELRGAGLTVTLDDAPRGQAGAQVPADALPDDLVVHEQDVQAVVNALRAGGAEGMTVMGERLTATSSVRCVGNTLLLHGRVYSPPFTITAVGDPDRLRRSLAESPGVGTYLTFVRAYGLGWSVVEERSLTLPAYEGPLELPTVLS
jgi:uncharacterized protein YlxW (UPF0749 family)